jgi:DNA-binding NtrC family response regulator
MNREVLRQIVYISRNPDQALQQLLIKRDWNVLTCRSVQQAERLFLGAERSSVGIFDVSTCFSDDASAFESARLHTRLEWIATPTEAQLHELAVRRYIRKYHFDFVTLPAPAQRVAGTVDRAYQMALLNTDVEPQSEQDDMIGDCDSMRQLFRAIGKVANNDAPVLICGESGTGKELTAKSVHQKSARRAKPFVALNCGAIPHTLLQSELFGYERGAFTGANARQIGLVEAANHGTLFLDEIGDLPLESQVSLLRLLQEHSIQRLGGREAVRVDVRIISATHVDLETAVRDGRFRADLFHRLCVLRLEEPPLRARGRDIELLAERMFERYRGDTPRAVRGFSISALNAMLSYTWPGNVRELINRVRRAIVMGEGRMITPSDLGITPTMMTPATTLAESRKAAERRAIDDALMRNRNRPTSAAQELGVSRVTLYRLMLEHGLREPKGEVLEFAQRSEANAS